MTQLWYIAIFCVLISLSVRGQEIQECSNAVEISEGQGLELNSEVSKEGPIVDVTDRIGCVKTCCSREDCHLAIMDGQDQCFIVSCMKDGKDVCRLRDQEGSIVFIKKAALRNSTDICGAPKEVGPCRASMPRFYYDGSNCEEFIYGGCGGNGNNFETLEVCKTACKNSPGTVESKEIPSGRAARRLASADMPERCLAATVIGPCRGSFPRYFYNGTAGTCQSFIYGGCRGNKNNYQSIEECQAFCSEKVAPSPRKIPGGNSNDSKSITAPPAGETACTALFETGPCRAAFPRFYYDSASQSCLPFIYGGCQGNGNRFTSVEECMSRCSGQEGNTGKQGHQPNRTPAYIMVGTLAVSSVVALVGLLIVMMRKSKFHRRTRDDKEELLPEDQLATEHKA